MPVFRSEYQLNGFPSDHSDKEFKHPGRRCSSVTISLQQVSTPSTDKLVRCVSVIHQTCSQKHAEGEEVDDEVVDEVRRRVLHTAAGCKGHIDECDIKWIKDTDDLIFRNILRFRDTRPREQYADAMYTYVHDMVINTLKWRHDFGINTIKDEDIPKEFFEAKGCLIYVGTDGRLYAYLKARKFKRFSSVWMEIGLKYSLHEIDKRLREFSYAHKHGVYDLSPVIIFDAHGTGLAQVDLKYAFYARGILLNHYQKTFKEFWIYGMPWWARPIMSLLLKAVPSYITNCVKLVDLGSMITAIGEENVPRSIGGAGGNIRPGTRGDSDGGRARQEDRCHQI